MKHCETCGVAMPGAHGRRKFCSERCRKAQYGGICVDCGAATYGGAGSAYTPERCARCRNARMQTVEHRLAASDGALAAAVRWPDSYLLAALKRAAGHCDGYLSAGVYNALVATQPFDEPLPCAATIGRRFGGWSAAMEAAGLMANPRNRDNYRRTSAEECLAAVAQVAEECGRVPSYLQYTALARDRDDLPSGPLVRVRCGSWGAVIRALSPAEAAA